MTLKDMDLRCPVRVCGRLMSAHEGSARCDHCGVIVLIPSAQTDELLLAHRRATAMTAAAQRDVQQGFRDWLANDAYWDGHGYRLKSDKRRRASWSKAVLALYPQCDDFHEAAQFFALPSENRAHL
jgi:hypothetical protein